MKQQQPKSLIRHTQCLTDRAISRIHRAMNAGRHLAHLRYPAFERPRAGRRSSLSALSLALLLPTVGFAQTLEEVLVTAELRETPWLEQAASSSIIGSEQVRDRAAAHLEELLLLAPNINVAGGSSRARFYQIRGVGERSQFIEPLNPSVGLLIDGIDFSGLGTAATLFDIEQVEILRGPQGTLHGANALAGLINMRSARPSDSFSGRVQTTFGDYGRRELGASVSGPLGSDSLLYRAAAFQHRSDGFIDNSHLGRDDTNERDELLLRGRLHWAPAEEHSVDLTLMHIDVDNGYDAFSLDNTRTTLSDMPGRDSQESDALGLHWQRSGTRINSSVLASIADSESEYSYDEDWSFVGVAPDLEYSSFDQYLRERRSYSAQLRLSGAEPIALGKRSVEWVAGIYWLDDDESLQRRYTYLASDFYSRNEVSTTALYGQLDVALSPELTLTTGLRADRRDTRYTDSRDIAGSPTDNLWGGKLALSYQDTTLGMFYASLSRGYRAGGVNAGILAAPPSSDPTAARLDGLRFFDDELLYNVELGHKYSSADGRLQSALALFYMDRRDQQVRGSLVLPREDGSTAFIDFTDNAASGHNFGLEGELRFAATQALELYVNVGLLRARFDDYVNADGVDLENRDQAHAPAYQFATGITYRPAPRWQLDLQWEGRDEFFFSDRHDEQAEAFSLWHLRAAYDSERWGVALWGRNLTDKDYFVRGFGSFGNDPRKGYITEEYVQFGEPRQIGMTLELRL